MAGADDDRRTSKRLSYVLRHDPASVGLELGPGGWVAVDELLGALGRHGAPLTRTELEGVVERNDKQRFAFSPDGARVRASQGHSVEVDLGLAAAEPPDVLFHGTVAEVLAAITTEGLTRQRRRHVHLSAHVETATRVGARRGRPVVLVVDARAMHAAGHRFERSANGVWLTDHVPPTYLTLDGTALDGR